MYIKIAGKKRIEEKSSILSDHHLTRIPVSELFRIFIGVETSDWPNASTAVSKSFSDAQSRKGAVDVTRSAHEKIVKGHTCTRCCTT